jgi:DNA-binding transcriptional ArsR family regulator
MGHGAKTADSAAASRTRLTTANAAQVATTLQALSTPSRLLILARLREGPCAATELAAEVGMEQSACSHQLRLLRNLGLVTGTRRGRSIVYALHDDHVAALLDQAVHHIEHLRLGVVDAPAGPDDAHGTGESGEMEEESEESGEPEPSLP